MGRRGGGGYSSVKFVIGLLLLFLLLLRHAVVIIFFCVQRTTERDTYRSCDSDGPSARHRDPTQTTQKICRRTPCAIDDQ